MSRTIWKFDIGEQGQTATIETPANPTFIHVGLDPEGKLCVWAEVDDEFEDQDNCLFGIFTDNVKIPDGWVHFRSLVVSKLVFHIYQYDVEYLGEPE